MVNKGITSWMAGGSQGVTGTSIAIGEAMGRVMRVKEVGWEEEELQK
jgi:hypothetical protein